MGLLDAFKKHKDKNAAGGGDGTPVPAGASPQPAAEGQSAPDNQAQRLLNMPLRQWLAETAGEWDKADAGAAETSETSPQQAREVMGKILPLDDQKSVAQMGMLLVIWGLSSEPSPFTFYVCDKCGYQVQLLGTVDMSGQAPLCERCHEPMAGSRIVYSRQVGRAIREFLAGHGRCIEAVAPLYAAMREGGQTREQLNSLLSEAMTVAKREDNAPAQKAVVRAWLILRLAQAASPAAAGTEVLCKEVKGSTDTTDGQADSIGESVAMVASLVAEVTKVGYDSANNQEGDLAICAYEQAVKLRGDLVAAFSRNIDLRVAQACDLDELGMTLRLHAPDRHAEALTHVRTAMQMMESLYLDDPPGRENRKQATDEIRAHLGLAW